MPTFPESPVIWEPPPEAWERSRLADFAGSLDQPVRAAIDDYPSLLRWSLDDPDAFWMALSDWADIPWHDRPTRALAAAAMPGARWFPGGTLNYAELALRQASATPDELAIISVSQTRERHEMTWTDLRDQVARCRAGLVSLGVARGDRVAALLPNIAETTVAFLATASIGAIWSSCAPEFGVRAVVDRLVQIEPTVLLTIDGYRYGEREIDRSDHVAQIVGSLPSIEHVVRLPYLDPTGPDDWSTLLDHDPAEIAVDPVPFEHPLYVLFSSGTTLSLIHI